jgi:hypothetical protein
MLGLIVLGAVLTVTLVFALAAYLIDKGEERLEEGELTRSAPLVPDEEHLKHGK